jgi:hypothetical protein
MVASSFSLTPYPLGSLYDPNRLLSMTVLSYWLLFSLTAIAQKNKLNLGLFRLGFAWSNFDKSERKLTAINQNKLKTLPHWLNKPKSRTKGNPSINYQLRKINLPFNGQTMLNSIPIFHNSIISLIKDFIGNSSPNSVNLLKSSRLAFFIISAKGALMW